MSFFSNFQQSGKLEKKLHFKSTLKTAARILTGIVTPPEVKCFSIIGTMVLTECEMNAVRRVQRKKEAP
jgi:hypothetical protein